MHQFGWNKSDEIEWIPDTIDADQTFRQMKFNYRLSFYTKHDHIPEWNNDTCKHCDYTVDRDMFIYSDAK